VAAATLVGDGGGSAVLPADPPVGATDTTKTFEDIDGNGIDDDCQDLAGVAGPIAAAAALAAADLDHDGTISVSEAAQSGWTGGTNCNHGGYVSGVAHATGDEGDEGDDGTDGAAPIKAECPATQPAPVPAADEPVDTSPNAHGKAVSKVAESDAVGGKNCNHGGAVSAAAKKDHSGPHDKAATKAHGKGKSHGKK
jgi:hypothetical protein